MGELLSVKEWARGNGRDDSYTRRLISSGRLPAVRIGKQWAIDSETPPDAGVKSGKYKNRRDHSRRSFLL